MKKLNSLTAGILKTLSVAVLKRTGPREYTFVVELPKFYREIFLDIADGSPCLSPWKYSAMLDSFVDEVEDFEQSDSKEMLSSGIWQEDGLGNGSVFLIANAFREQGEVILVIRNILTDYPNHITILQKARENLLAQQSLHRSLAFYKHRSSIDALTTLYNRETFFGLLSTEITHSLFSNQPLSVLMIDIDNFKTVNDTYGHLVGDKVLHQLGNIFKDILRSRDIAARYGGEEFVVCTLGTTLVQAGQLAEKIRNNVADYEFPSVSKVTVSIGVAMFHEGDSIETCINRADQALYRAKALGKNQVCFSEVDEDSVEPAL